MPRHTLEAITSCPNLPTLPSVAVQVLERTCAASVEVHDIEEVVQLDPALAAKILKTVNSSYYGLSKPCPTIGRALMYLGLSTVKSLVLGFSLVDMARRHGHGLDLPAYWQRSIFAAVAARRLAAQLGTCDPDEAFVAAIMQDIGMLALDRALEGDYTPVLASAGARHDRLPAAEQAAFGFDHAHVGAALAEKWRLPAAIIDAIRWHHCAGAPEAPAIPLVIIAAFACHLHETLLEGGLPPARLAALGRDLLMLAPEDLGALASAARSDAKEIAQQFSVNVGELPDPDVLMVQAEEALVAHQISVVRQAEELSRQARADALTGVGNRKAFDEDLEAEFSRAQRHGQGLGLVLADADRFKLLNDSHGHQAGDAVLVELARRLQQAIGNAGMVCRYGGEEFAVILPGASRSATAQLAEAMRTAVAAAAFAVASRPAALRVEVTASFGAAVLEPAAPTFPSPAVMVRAADMALYAAKGAGRNCVRVFRPRPASSPAGSARANEP